MAENKMMVRVIAPERVFYEGEASFLEFNTIEGIIGLYPKHIPMTVVVAPGVLKSGKMVVTRKRLCIPVSRRFWAILSQFWQSRSNGRMKSTFIVPRKQRFARNAASTTTRRISTGRNLHWSVRCFVWRWQRKCNLILVRQKKRIERCVLLCLHATRSKSGEIGDAPIGKVENQADWG